MMSDNQPVRLVGICGSLRKSSFNRSLLRAAGALLPEGVELSTAEIRDVPLYDQDVLDASGFPPSVQALRAAIAAADGVLIASPEYNFSMPGVLKNAIDWASRGSDQPFAGKTLGIMGATPGGLGTVRAQMHLRQVCIFLNLVPLHKPELMVSRAHEKFNAAGELTDEKTQKELRAFLAALVDFTRRLRAPASPAK